MRIYVTIAGIDTNLSESDPLEIVSIGNLGAAKATRITERGPSQDGDSDNDRVLEPRMIPIVLQARSSVAYTYEDNRDLINKLFKATNVPIRLTFIFDSGKTRAIDTQSVGDINLPLALKELAVIKTGIMLRAANPTFYDPVAQSLSFGLTTGGATAVPTAVPTPVGGSILDQTAAIVYDGTYADFPLLYIYGPITNPKIENLTTGDFLDFNGYTIANGDYYTIDLRYGRKQLYRNGNTADNRINELTSSSTIATFSIKAHPDVTDGLNLFRVTGSSASGATQVFIQYYRRYDGT